MSDDLPEIKALIIANLDVMDFLDILGMELADLVDIPEIEEQIENEKPRLIRACR